MDYYELNFKTGGAEAYQQDLLIDALGQIGFDTFEEVDGGFKAYIPSDDFDEAKIKAELGIFESQFQVNYELSFIPQQNWNQLWERNFEPIPIGDKIYVRATFHPPVTGFPHEIVIDPKMAFGTGHHQTTSMMLEFMLGETFDSKNVLDMGCGTGILAIMASKLGAGNIVAIDNDPVCYASAIENASLNQVENVSVICGSKEAIPTEKFDIILANINRNILTEQLPSYSAVLKPGGILIMSGFYQGHDAEIIVNEATRLGFRYISSYEKENWAAVKVVI